MKIEQVQKRKVKSVYFGDYTSYVYRAEMQKNGRKYVGFGHTFFRAIENLLNQL